MLAWIDCETTGLVARDDEVLEVACIVTDDQLKEVARFHAVVQYADAAELAKLDINDQAAIEKAAEQYGIDEVVIKMHLENGLWAECASPAALPLREVDRLLADCIQTHAWVEKTITGKGGTEKKVTDRPQLAGSTVSFDRTFLAEHCPVTHLTLHYRNLDTSTLNELWRRVRPAVYEQRPRADKPAHRAMADIIESIVIVKYYATRLEPVPLDEPGRDVQPASASGLRGQCVDTHHQVVDGKCIKCEP